MLNFFHCRKQGSQTKRYCGPGGIVLSCLGFSTQIYVFAKVLIVLCGWLNCSLTSPCVLLVTAFFSPNFLFVNLLTECLTFKQLEVQTPVVVYFK